MHTAMGLAVGLEKFSLDMSATANLCKNNNLDTAWRAE
jgi:hypothetical protein